MMKCCLFRSDMTGDHDTAPARDTQAKHTTTTDPREIATLAGGLLLPTGASAGRHRR